MNYLRRSTAIIAALLLGAGASLLGATAAEATQETPGYKLFAWNITSGDAESPWGTPRGTNPQTFRDATPLYTNDMSDSAAFLDERADTLPRCGIFQLDIYKYGVEDENRTANIENVDALAVGGVLNGPSNPFNEPLISGGSGVAYIVVDNSAGCEPQHVPVTLCHATNADGNQYVVVTVDDDSIDNHNGHGSHTGPIWNPTLKDQHIMWGDIIPPFTWTDSDGTHDYPGLNWTEKGQRILRNGCVIPDERDASASVSTTPATCDVGETLVYGDIVNATWKNDSTADGTSGPGSYAVAAKANAGHAFANGDAVKGFNGTLGGPLTGRQCATQPSDDVVDEYRSTCNQVDTRTGTTPYVWDEEQGKYVPGETTYTAWDFVRYLTAEESTELGCEPPAPELRYDHFSQEGCDLVSEDQTPGVGGFESYTTVYTDKYTYDAKTGTWAIETDEIGVRTNYSFVPYTDDEYFEKCVTTVPKDTVSKSDWVDEQFKCDDTTVEQTRSVITTTYVWDAATRKFVTGTVTTVNESRTRDLTADEQTVCPPPVPEEPMLPHTGPIGDAPMIGVAGILLIALGVVLYTLVGSRRKV